MATLSIDEVQQLYIRLSKNFGDKHIAQKIIRNHYPYAVEIFNNSNSKQSKPLPVVDIMVNVDQPSEQKSCVEQIDEPIVKQVDESIVVKVKKEKTVKQKIAKGESKMDRAKMIYNNSTDKSRKTIIKLFVDQLQLSEACASTYAAICKKDFSNV